MNIPKKVKVGGITYKVKKVKKIDRSDSKTAGLEYEFEQKIYLNKGLEKNIEEKIFLHELIHTILDHADIREHDEHIVEVLANGLLMVIKDNPNIFRED